LASKTSIVVALLGKDHNSQDQPPKPKFSLKLNKIDFIAYRMLTQDFWQKIVDGKMFKEFNLKL
jgi:hypothetical protein